jgi:hypothetical protein
MDEPAPAASTGSREHRERPIDTSPHPLHGSGWCCCHTPGPSQLIPDPINAAQMVHDSEVVMEHGRKRWLGVVTALRQRFKIDDNRTPVMPPDLACAVVSGRN